MHRRIKIWQRQLAISMQSIPKSVIETVDLRKSYVQFNILFTRMCNDLHLQLPASSEIILKNSPFKTMAIACVYWQKSCRSIQNH
jgi:hypothetical protein